MKWNWVEKNTFSVSQKSLWKACSSDFRWPTADRKERKKISNLNWGAKVTYLKKRKLGFIKHVYIYTRICYVFFFYPTAVLFRREIFMCYPEYWVNLRIFFLQWFFFCVFCLLISYSSSTRKEKVRRLHLSTLFWEVWYLIGVLKKEPAENFISVSNKSVLKCKRAFLIRDKWVRFLWINQYGQVVAYPKRQIGTNDGGFFVTLYFIQFRLTFILRSLSKDNFSAFLCVTLLISLSFSLASAFFFQFEEWIKLFKLRKC